MAPDEDVMYFRRDSGSDKKVLLPNRGVDGVEQACLLYGLNRV